MNKHLRKIRDAAKVSQQEMDFYNDIFDKWSSGKSTIEQIANELECPVPTAYGFVRRSEKWSKGIKRKLMQQSVVEMRDVRGKDWQKIADKLGTSISTVYRLYAEADKRETN